jgi:hypothetical protein
MRVLPIVVRQRLGKLVPAAMITINNRIVTGCVSLGLSVFNPILARYHLGKGVPAARIIFGGAVFYVVSFL